MTRFFLSVLIGLCLAISTAVGCGNEGPIIPPINAGSITIINDSDGQLIANEPVTLLWDFVPRIDRYTIDYSIDGGDTWFPIGETRNLTSVNWQIPPGTETSAFIVRVDGYSNRYTAPRSRSVSVPMLVVPYGEIASFNVNLPTETAVDVSTNLIITARDEYDNVVVDYVGTWLLIVNDGTISFTIPFPLTGNDAIVLPGVNQIITGLFWDNGICTPLNHIIFHDTGTGVLTIIQPMHGSGTTTIR
jgi:hypothetical protein